ncbi:MAG: hypothetical protein J6D08_14440 [Lachnospiraceae bacterium]|nr:hypothetical protein [Lachnospiraceae bacterium]
MINYTVLSLGEMLRQGFDIDIIEKAFKKFSCQRETDLENFLVNKAITYENTEFGKTYLLVDDDLLKNGDFSVAAYFTIAHTAVDISGLSKKKKRVALGNYPGRDNLNLVSSYLIGQLGRNDAYTTDDLPGELILDECYHAISVAARAIGGKLLVLECREHMYEKFYENQGFKKLYDELNSENLYTLFKKIDFNEYWSK